MKPSTPLRRRRYLSTLAGLGVLGAGCADATNDETTPTGTSGTTPTPNGSEYPEPDERVEERPPGEPPLDPSGSWPALHFDAGNTSFNPDGSGLRHAEPYWRLAAGGPATVDDGSLYNVTGRDRDEKALTFRDPATAEIREEQPLVPYGVSAPPELTDDRVFVSTFIEVFCFDHDGDQRWRGPEMDGVQAPPTAHDGVVFLNSGGFRGVPPQLRAFDADESDELWRYETGHESKGKPAVGAGHVFVASEAGLHAVDADTGEEAYVRSVGRSAWETPVVRDGRVYTYGTRDGTDALFAVDAHSGEIQWHVETGHDDPPVVAEEFVYATTDDELTAFAVEDGAPEVGFGEAATPLARVGDVLYASHRGTALAFDATTGDRLWRLRTEEVTISDTVGRAVHAVTPVDGAVYVSARDAFYGVGPS